jgi:enoyl-CoA hydratase/carnithine racemase
MPEVISEKHEQVTLITLNRPERMNAMNRALRIELATAFCQFRDDHDARVAVLTGAGRAFCAGIDLREQERRQAGDLTPPTIAPHVNPFWDPGGGERELTKPVIAAVNGHAIGGGFLLATHADLIIAAESASFDLAVMNRGLPAGWDLGGRLNLSHQATMELALGERMQARRAYDAGLINRVVPDDSLLEQSLALASRVSSRPPLAIQGNVELVRSARSMDAQALANLSGELTARARSSPETAGTMAAFVERRPV